MSGSGQTETGKNNAEKESAGKTGNARKTESTESSGIGIINMEKTCPHAGRNHADPERKWLPDIYYGSKKMREKDEDSNCR